MADILIKGIEVAEGLDIILNTCTNKVVYSKNNGMTWKEAAGFIVLTDGHGRVGDTVDTIAQKIYAALDALDRGTDNDWARAALEEANQILDDYYKKEVYDNGVL